MTLAPDWNLVRRAALSLVAGWLGVWQPLRAEEVQMFDHPPTLKELRQALVPERSTGGGSLTRAIVFPNASAGAAASATQVSAPVKPVGLPIQFRYNSTEFLPESRAYLDQMGKLLQSEPVVTMMIEGHTDSAGSAEYNQGLSERRAVVVRKYLLSAYGIAPGRLQFAGLGKTMPVDGFDPSAPVNRRVQFRRLN